MGVIDRIVDSANIAIQELSEILPQWVFSGIVLFFFAVIIAFTAFIIWKFYNTLSKRNFITLNLRQYDWSDHPATNKFGAVILYFIEYIFLMPALILLWFTLLSVVLLIIASDRNIDQLLLLSGAMILAIRILAYYNEEISKDLAKLFPFIALSVFLLTPGAFEVNGFFDNLKGIPTLFDNILFFLVVIFGVEIVLRFVYTSYELATGNEDVEADDD